ncbi:unnamed protein product [Symbiodinium necroappetens]|uniref:Uncharacterized protein n=1 Tax=Symbiodinium necroappetens TaxID=1628268 RepID=A0A812K238_9DINO|nr:unnamed protein product [Symbiodinium necroappetens]
MDILATVLQSYSPTTLPKNMKAESMLEFLRTFTHMDQMSSWLEAVARDEVPCTPALLFHYCIKGFPGFNQCQQQYFYPTGLNYNLTRHVNETVSIVCDALILARAFPTSLSNPTVAPPTRRETVEQFLDQYFGHGWSNWYVPYGYTPDYTKAEYHTSEFSVVRAEIDNFSNLP